MNCPSCGKPCATAYATCTRCCSWSACYTCACGFAICGVCVNLPPDPPPPPPPPPTEEDF